MAWQGWISGDISNSDRVSILYKCRVDDLYPLDISRYKYHFNDKVTARVIQISLFNLDCLCVPPPTFLELTDKKDEKLSIRFFPKIYFRPSGICLEVKLMQLKTIEKKAK